MAIGILADSSTDPELKKWAVEIVAKNSPIRFSDNLEDKLRMGSTLKIFAHLNIVPNDLLQPPLQLLPNEPGNANENYKRSRENSRKLTELQEWVRISKTK